ncbi:hypothetical protein N9A92_01095 [Pirellulales bacterium]|nr:hypothetical protein [Pirellulales bacterium]MDA7938494.1 hypothetical protein [Pirellulales bacterium]
MNFFIVLTTFVLLGASGCGPQGVTEKRFSNPAPDAIDRAAALIQGYAEGQPVGSETMEFEELAQGVTAIDAQKGSDVKEFLTKVERTGRVSRKDAAKVLEGLKE